MEALLETAQRAALDYFRVASGSLLIDSPDVTITDPRRPWSVSIGPDTDGSEVRELAERVYQADIEALAAAAATNIIPAGFQDHGPLQASSWLRSERRIQGALRDEISDQLKRTGWRFVFHVTAAERLKSIGRFGIVDGGMVDTLAADPLGLGDRRRHGDRTKQDLLYARVFCGFWPPWWLFTPRHYGERSAVILAVDASAICLQPGCIYVDRPAFEGSITGDDLRNRSNSSPGGTSAWRSCWADGPRPRPKAEIIGARIHPRHIRYVLFPDKATQLRFWPDYEQAFFESYPDLADDVAEPTGREISQGRTSMGFPPDYVAPGLGSST